MCHVEKAQCDRELRVAVADSQLGTEALSPTAQKELNPDNNMSELGRKTFPC